MELFSSRRDDDSFDTVKSQALGFSCHLHRLANISCNNENNVDIILLKGQVVAVPATAKQQKVASSRSGHC